MASATAATRASAAFWSRGVYRGRNPLWQTAAEGIRRLNAAEAALAKPYRGTNPVLRAASRLLDRGAAASATADRLLTKGEYDGKSRTLRAVARGVERLNGKRGKETPAPVAEIAGREAARQNTGDRRQGPADVATAVERGIGRLGRAREATRWPAGARTMDQVRTRRPPAGQDLIETATAAERGTTRLGRPAGEAPAARDARTGTGHGPPGHAAGARPIGRKAAPEGPGRSGRAHTAQSKGTRRTAAARDNESTRSSAAAGRGKKTRRTAAKARGRGKDAQQHENAEGRMTPDKRMRTRGAIRPAGGAAPEPGKAPSRARGAAARQEERDRKQGRER